MYNGTIISQFGQIHDAGKFDTGNDYNISQSYINF